MICSVRSRSAATSSRLSTSCTARNPSRQKAAFCSSVSIIPLLFVCHCPARHPSLCSRNDPVDMLTGIQDHLVAIGRVERQFGGEIVIVAYLLKGQTHLLPIHAALQQVSEGARLG